VGGICRVYVYCVPDFCVVVFQYLVSFLSNLNFLDTFLNPQISNFIKVYPVEMSCSMQMDRHDEVAFCKVVQTPKNTRHIHTQDSPNNELHPWKIFKPYM